MKGPKTKKLVTSAMLIAVATALALVSEMIPFLQLRFGGTLTLASMLPIILISFIYGVKWGLGSAFIYSLIQLFLGIKTVSALFVPDSDSYMMLYMALCVVLLDYLVAHTALGLGGLFAAKKRTRSRLILGCIVSQGVCYLAHLVSGAVFYGAWAEWFFTETAFAELDIATFIMSHFSGNALSLIYSVVYNGLYMIPEMILTCIVAFFIFRISAVSERTSDEK